MRQVLPIAGAIVGAYFGNPQLGFAIGSLIGNVVDPQEIQGSKVGDNPMQTASEGGARAIVFGTGCVRATCLLERGNRQIVEVEDQAGKGGPVTVNERVYWTFAIGLGEAIPGGAIIRIWEGEKLVYDVSPGSPIPAETAEFARKFRFYDGSEDQLPDPALEAINGVGNTHYYRGTAYVVFPNYDLTDYREQIPVFRWEISSAADVNEFSVIYEDITPELSPPTARVFSWSPGGDYLAAALTGDPYLHIYKRDGGTFTRLDAVEGTSGFHAVGMGWRADGEVLAVSQNSGQRIVAYRKIGDIFSRVPDPDWPPGWADNQERGLVWIGDSIIVPYNQTFFSPGDFRKWVYAGGTLTGSPDITLLPTRPSTFESAVYFDSVLTIGLAEPPFVAHFLGDYSSLGTLGMSPGGDFIRPTYGDGGKYLYGTTTNSPYLLGWRRSGFEFDAVSMPEVANPATALSAQRRGSLIAVTSHGVACAIYQNSGGTFTEVGAWSPTGVVGELASFSPNGRNLAVSTNRGIHVLGLASSVDKISLSSILTALHLRAGHKLADFDVSECPEMVTGIVFESSVTFAEAINSVIGSYFKDPSEYDRKIHYLSRGKAVVRTLTEDDLVDEPETSRRENAIEYPRKLHYFFQSPITHYAATKATSARSSPDVHVIGEVSVSSPITYDNPDEPAQVSAKLHKVYWADAEGEIVWHVTDEHADLVPGDCVGLNLRGVVRRARITSIEDDPGVRKLTMRVDRQSAYTSNVTGIPLPPPTPPRPSIIAPSIGLTLDIPALTDDADDLHYLRAITGLTDVWAGAVDQRSMDGGASFASINTATQAAVVGVLQGEVTAASPHFTDTTNVVAVDLFVDRDIESISDQQFLSEGGAFALSYMDGAERKWELCQYRDSEEDSGGNKLLSTLHRGLLNTEAAAHAPGDYFVLLGRGILKNNAQSAWLGQEMVHRAVSNGLTPETAATETTTYTGQSQREFPVASVDLSLAGDELTVSIVPRHRFGTDDAPIRSINWTGYRVLATDGANSESYDTTSDTSVVDVTGWTGTITVTVSQTNRITGAGPTVTESIPA